MTAIFAFDDTDEHLPSGSRGRRDTVSSINSFDDRWIKASQEQDLDSHPRIHHFGSAWDNIVEEDETPLRVGTPPIPIPNGSGHTGAHQHPLGGSVQVEFEAEYVARGEGGSLNRKMVPADFEQVRVLGKGGYGTVLLVRHRESGRLFAQKQLKKASLVVQTKILGMATSNVLLMIEYTKSERTILEEIKNPFVVKLFYAFQDSNKLYLILEVSYLVILRLTL